MKPKTEYEYDLRKSVVEGMGTTLGKVTAIKTQAGRL